jgi:hypothetical protein
MHDRRRRTWLLRLGVVALAGSLALATFSWHHDHADERGRLSGTPSRGLPGTTFRVASFNVLGAVHTDTGQRPGWAKSSRRMTWAVQLMQEHDLQVFGLQEFEAVQYDKFKELTGTTYGTYPGIQLGRRATVQNSIAWRRDTWKLVSAHTIRVPYFYGNRIRMPYVLLQNRATGENVWFYNVHNPADTHGYAWKWRRQGYQIEADLVARLRAADPSTAVIATGDKNEREKYFCYAAAHSILHSANGGSFSNGVCSPPPDPLAIDWVSGTSDVRFDNYLAFRDDLVRKTTDHPIVMADATIAPRTPPTASHVVVVSVQGLTSRALAQAGATGAPALTRMITDGASTLNARTEVERTSEAANVVGMLTGRPVDPAHAGHGVDWLSTPSTTVKDAAGHYVTSAYDLVHNYGYRTSFLARGADLGIVGHSWGDGSVDRVGVNNGRDKITHAATYDTDGAVVRTLRDELSSAAPTLAFAHLGRPARIGERYGFASPEFAAAVSHVSAAIGRIQSAIQLDPSLAGHTLLVVTAGSGGGGKQYADPSRLRDYRIPFLVTGPDVAAGTDLYALNPQLQNPGTARVGYTGAQPVRNGFVANLVTKALGMPPVTGSKLDPDQSFTAFAPSP